MYGAKRWSEVLTLETLDEKIHLLCWTFIERSMRNELQSFDQSVRIPM